MTAVRSRSAFSAASPAPFGQHDPLPSLLPAGYSQTARLLGPSPSAGWDGCPAQAQPDGTGVTPPPRAPGAGAVRVSRGRSEVARDHLQHELMHLVEET